MTLEMEKQEYSKTNCKEEMVFSEKILTFAKL